MELVIAPDSFGGTLSAPEAAAAIAEGWQRARPDDRLVLVPMSDGGEGLLEVLGAGGGRWHREEVADPLGHPREARWLERPDGTVVIECAEACGLALVPPPRRTPLDTTTYGVGQLLEAARRGGAERVLVGLGGSATVDGGAGAVTALGLRVLVADGSGLKIGGRELHRVARVASGWEGDWSAVDVDLLADVRTVLLDAPRMFGPQKGATSDDVPLLERGLAAWADVVERDLDRPGLRRLPGTGAAGGLGFGLAAAVGADLVPGARRVAELVGLAAAVERADLVVTGEGRVDPTSGEGKVLGAVQELSQGRPVLAVVGAADGEPEGLADLEESAPDGPGEDPAGEVAAAAERLARRR